jgi:hypothetical protein
VLDGALPARPNLLALDQALRRIGGVGRSQPPPPLTRDPPFLVIGTADIGALLWCEAKATMTQRDMERAFASRALHIVGATDPVPAFVSPHRVVGALEATTPEERHARRARERERQPRWKAVEEHETTGTWHMGFVAVLQPADLRDEHRVSVVLVGITDGVRSDGTVVEVRHSTWDWASLEESREVEAKEIQANIYAVMLGLPRWSCVFQCADGRKITEGYADETRAFVEIRKAARYRLGLDEPRGVSWHRRHRCSSRGGRKCEFLSACGVSPLRGR